MPFSNRAMIIEAGQERVVTIMKVENNVTIPADRFALPAEIKALVAGKK